MTRVVSYDRAGMGQSAVRPTPHTSHDNAVDLHAVLVTAQIPRPYILVAHSQAAFTAALYVQHHVQEVAGLIFVDPAHPDQYAAYLAQLPVPTPDESPLLAGLRRSWSQGPTDPSRNSEGIDVFTSCQQVRRVTSFGSVPLVVLTSGDFLLNTQLPPAVAQALHQVRWHLHERWARMSSQSTHTLLASYHHDLPEEAPETVVEAIRQVLTHSSAARDSSSAAG